MFSKHLGAAEKAKQKEELKKHKENKLEAKQTKAAATEAFWKETREAAKQHLFGQAKQVRKFRRQKFRADRERFAVRVVSASRLARADRFGLSDPFARVHVVSANDCDWSAGTAIARAKLVEKGGTMIGKTNVVRYSLNPRWSTDKNRFIGEVPEKDGCLVVEVWDNDLVGSNDFLGEIMIKGEEVRRLMDEEYVDLTFDLSAKGGRSEKEWTKYVGAKATMVIRLKRDEDEKEMAARLAAEEKAQAASLLTISSPIGTSTAMLPARVAPPPPARAAPPSPVRNSKKTRKAKVVASS
jgi:hypothetical protein